MLREFLFSTVRKCVIAAVFVVGVVVIVFISYSLIPRHCVFETNRFARNKLLFQSRSTLNHALSGCAECFHGIGHLKILMKIPIPIPIPKTKNITNP